MTHEQVADLVAKHRWPPLPRVDFDTVAFDDQQALVDGTPFTGIIYSSYPDGQLDAESNYRDGLPEGVQIRWYPDGKLESYWIAIWSKGSSESYTWHPNGRPQSYRRNLRLIPIELREWDPSGQLIRDERHELPS